MFFSLKLLYCVPGKGDGVSPCCWTLCAKIHKSNDKKRNCLKKPPFVVDAICNDSELGVGIFHTFQECDLLVWHIIYGQLWSLFCCF